jgi:alkanesulfonate monooxygenase SsuD/methylene tetrahydromethanopterin reductase-like flavin-dependent oxidoreductase (luciferase family)
MRFGVLQFFSWSRRVPLATVYERALQRIEVMDQTGYDAVWVAEHHFSTYSVCPSPLLMGMQAAARTKRLRIGTAVTLAAFYNPLRLAEELAMLDILSGGRLNWGAGRGFEAAEFRAFDVPPEESSDRFRECVEIVRAAWSSDRLTYRGKYWQFEDVEVLPKPLQQPSPPVWLAATSHESVRRAAEKGYSILMDPHSTNTELAEKRRYYDAQLKEHGHSTEGRTIPMARLIAVGKTEEEARDVAASGVNWTISSYANPKHSTETDPAKLEEWGPQRAERYLREVVLYGTAEQMVDRLAELRETIGLEYLVCAPLSHESFVLFTEKVLPRLM